MSIAKWEIGALVIVVALTALVVAVKKSGPATPGNLEPKFLTYHNAAYGYQLKYPETFRVKEITPETVVFERGGGEVMAEANIVEVAGQPGQTFNHALERSLVDFCANRSEVNSLACSKTNNHSPFFTASGQEGQKLYLEGRVKAAGGATSTPVKRGPYFVFLLKTGATASRALLINAPLAKSPAQADLPAITALANSLILEKAR
jgi:hypothetical protein